MIPFFEIKEINEEYTDSGRVFAYAQGPPGTQHTKNVNPREKITILAPFDISWHHLAF